MFSPGPYLILVTKKRLVGNIDGHLVYQIAETELVSFSKTSIHLSESQVFYFFCHGGNWHMCMSKVYMSLT